MPDHSRTPSDASRTYVPPAIDRDGGAFPLDETTARLIRERDNLFLLHEALADVERAGSLEERLRIFVEAIQRVGYGRVALTLRDEALDPTLVVTAGMSVGEEFALRDGAASGHVWRRRLLELERFRISGSYYVDARDAWVQREFGDAVPSRMPPAPDGEGWSPRDFLLVPLRGATGRLIGTLVVDDPADRAAPGLHRVRTVELFAQQVASIVDHARLLAVAERRAERLQLLQEGSRALANSLDEEEIARELARQVERLVDCDGVAIVLCGDDETPRPAARRVQGAETEPEHSAGCDRLTTQVLSARTPLRLQAHRPADAGAPADPARSALVGVPAMVGDRIVAVIAAWNRRAPFRDEELEVLATIAAQAAIAISNARRYAESLRERRRSEALADIARAVSSSLRVDDVTTLILRHAVALLHCEGAVLALLREGALHIVAGVGAGERVVGMQVPSEGTVASRVLSERAPVIVNDAFAEPAAYAPTRSAGAVQRSIMVPLFANDGVIGIVGVSNRELAFTDDDASVLQRLADHVGVAVANARLFEEHTALGERYRRVLETTSDAIVIVDRERRIAFTNPAADALLGVNGVPLGLPMAGFVPPEHREIAAAYETSALAGIGQRYEAVLARPDGERRTVAVSSAPLRDLDQVTGIVLSIHDVTEERRARDAVAESEWRYRNLFESATDAIYTLDDRGCFTSLNAATCHLTGLPRTELLGRSAIPLLPADELPRVKRHFEGALAGAARHYECHFVRADGTRRLASVTNTPIRHGADVVGVLGVARDVTEERARAAALARSEARYTRLVESASDAIFTVDVEGRVTSVNQALERAVGETRAVLVGAPFVPLIDPRDRALAGELFARTLAGERRRADLRYPTPGGELRSCSLMTTPIVEDGRITGALGIVRDVTDEKRLAEQLMQQEKLAAVGQLVSGVAHELNNPLAGIMAFSQLLLAPPPVEAAAGGADARAADTRRAHEAIHQEAKRAAKIVSNLLTFARQHQPERQITDLNRVVTDTAELRRYALRVHQVELDLRLDPALPLTWADPFQLQQVVLNLLTNAEQALADWRGPRRIVIATARVDARLVVRVSDTGPGIPAEHLARIFNPFFTTKPVGEGTGLGLSISDGIVREHGGRIRVESRPGAGATFVLELPHTAPPTVAPSVAGPPAARVSEARRVLVVDDEPAIRTALAAYLRSLGHVVDTATTGAEALDAALHVAYDGIVLDLRMPEQSGDEVYRVLAERRPALAGKVVFLTGDLQSESARRFLEATGRPVVTKPFLLDDVAAALLPDAGRGRADR